MNCPLSLCYHDVMKHWVISNFFKGQLTMIVHQPEDGPGRGWEDVGGGKMSAKMFRFLQRDIDEGRIWYKHMGASADDDFFTFEVWMQKIFLLYM